MNAQQNAPISDRFSSLCARVFYPAAAILESEKTLGTRLEKTNMADCLKVEHVRNYYPEIAGYSFLLLSFADLYYILLLQILVLHGYR